MVTLDQYEIMLTAWSSIGKQFRIDQRDSLSNLFFCLLFPSGEQDQVQSKGLYNDRDVLDVETP